MATRTGVQDVTLRPCEDPLASDAPSLPVQPEEETERLASVQLSPPSRESSPLVSMVRHLTLDALLQPEHCQVPGEAILIEVKDVLLLMQIGLFVKGTFMMTNYRIYFVCADKRVEERYNLTDFCSIPLFAVDRLEKTSKRRDEDGICVYTRDHRVLQFVFCTGMQERNKTMRCLESFCFVDKYADIFAFTLYTTLMPPKATLCPSINGWTLFSMEEELQRFNLNNAEYLTTDINKDYRICSSYPKTLVLLQGFSRSDMYSIANFRSKSRIPALTWKDPNSCASMWRCAQPKVGLGTARCMADERFFRRLSELNRENDVIQIFDARPKINAFGNRFTGAGYENADFYSTCKLQFMNIHNIHAVRDSYQRMAKICLKQEKDGQHSNWYTQLDHTGWLTHISDILKSVFGVVHAVHIEKATCVVHCSDGWDRTSQMCSLSQLSLDKSYRTMEGLIRLIEKDWVHFGHKFQQRNGFLSETHTDDQRAPIFLQFIECVYHLTVQFPFSFEFSSTFLVTLMDLFYSGCFGTFLFNTMKERDESRVCDTTLSLWTYFLAKPHEKRFLNPLFDPEHTSVLFPTYNLKAIHAWQEYWFRWTLHETKHRKTLKPVHGIPHSVASLLPRGLTVEDEIWKLHHDIEELEAALAVARDRMALMEGTIAQSSISGPP